MSIAKVMHLEATIDTMKNTLHEVTEVMKEHGSHIRELYLSSSSSASKAELGAAISTVRAQYLNGHIPSRRFDNVGFDSESSREIQQLRHALEVSERERLASASVVEMMEREIRSLKSSALENTLKLQEHDNAVKKRFDKLMLMLRSYGVGLDADADLGIDTDTGLTIDVLTGNSDTIEVKTAVTVKQRPLTAVTLPEYQSIRPPSFPEEDSSVSILDTFTPPASKQTSRDLNSSQARPVTASVVEPSIPKKLPPSLSSCNDPTLNLFPSESYTTSSMKRTEDDNKEDKFIEYSIKLEQFQSDSTNFKNYFEVCNKNVDRLLNALTILELDHSGLKLQFIELTKKLQKTEVSTSALVSGLAEVVESQRTELEKFDGKLLDVSKAMNTSLEKKSRDIEQTRVVERDPLSTIFGGEFGDDIDDDDFERKMARRTKNKEILMNAMMSPGGNIFAEIREMHRAYGRMVLEYQKLGDKILIARAKSAMKPNHHIEKSTTKEYNDSNSISDSIREAEELFEKFSSSLDLQSSVNPQTHKSDTERESKVQNTVEQLSKLYISRTEAFKLINGMHLRHQTDMQRLKNDLAVLRTIVPSAPTTSKYAGAVYDSETVSFPVPELKGRAFHISGQDNSSKILKTEKCKADSDKSSGSITEVPTSMRYSKPIMLTDEFQVSIERKLTNLDEEVFVHTKSIDNEKCTIAASPPIVSKSPGGGSARQGRAVKDTRSAICVAPQHTKKGVVTPQTIATIRKLAESVDIFGCDDNITDRIAFNYSLKAGDEDS